MTPSLLPVMAAAASIVAVSYKDTFGLGSIVVLFATVLAAAWTNTRRRESDRQTNSAIKAAQEAAEVAQQAAESWKLEREAEVVKTDRLTDMLEDERERSAEALSEVARLQALTDLTQVRHDMAAAFQAHETGAQSRHSEIVTLLRRIADCQPDLRPHSAETDGRIPQ